MERLLALEDRVALWSRWLALLGLFGLLVQAAGTTADVLGRWLANAPITGLFDINELAIAIVLSTTFPVVIAQRRNITITFLGSTLGPQRSLWLQAFGGLLTLFIVTMIAWELTKYIFEIHELGRATMVLLIPVAPFWSVAAVVIWLCVPFQAVCSAVDIARAILGRPAPEGEV